MMIFNQKPWSTLLHSCPRRVGKESTQEAADSMVSALNLCLLTLAVSLASSHVISTDPDSLELQPPTAERRTFKHKKPLKYFPLIKKHKKFGGWLPQVFGKAEYADVPTIPDAQLGPIYKIHRYQGIEVKPLSDVHSVTVSPPEGIAESHPVVHSSDFGSISDHSSPAPLPSSSFILYPVNDQPSFSSISSSPLPEPAFSSPSPPSFASFPQSPKPVFSFPPAPVPSSPAPPSFPIALPPVSIAPPVFSSISIARPLPEHFIPAPPQPAPPTLIIVPAPLPPSFAPAPSSPVFSFVPVKNPAPALPSIPAPSPAPVFSSITVVQPPSPPSLPADIKIPAPELPSIPAPSPAPILPSISVSPPPSAPAFPAIPSPSPAPAFPIIPSPSPAPAFPAIPSPSPAPAFPAIPSPSPAPAFPAFPSPSPAPAFPAFPSFPSHVKIPAQPSTPAPVFPPISIIPSLPAPAFPAFQSPAPAFPGVPSPSPVLLPSPAPALAVSASPEPEFPYPPSGTPIPSYIKDISLPENAVTEPTPTKVTPHYEEVAANIDNDHKTIDLGLLQKIREWKANAALNHFNFFKQKPISIPRPPVSNLPPPQFSHHPTIQFPVPIRPLPLTPDFRPPSVFLPQTGHILPPAKYESFPPNNIETPPLFNSYGAPIPHDTYAPHDRLAPEASEEEASILPPPPAFSEQKQDQNVKDDEFQQPEVEQQQQQGVQSQNFQNHFQGQQLLAQQQPIYVPEENKEVKEETKAIEEFESLKSSQQEESSKVQEPEEPNHKE